MWDHDWITHSSRDDVFSRLEDKSEIRRRLWKCFKLWITRPNAYDRSVGATRLFHFVASESVLGSLRRILQSVDHNDVLDVERLCTSLDDLLEQWNDRSRSSELPKEWNCDQPPAQCCIAVRLTFPKRLQSGSPTVCVFFYDIDDSLTCVTPGRPDKTYRLSLTSKENEYLVTAQIPAGVSPDAQTVRLISSFFTKTVIWSGFTQSATPSIFSVSLVGESFYLSMYNRLKEKYGGLLRKIWTECTNPEKFIYEDIAIASYLNLLWEPSTSFVDLGCGNGLLVFILTSEGHRGVGLDVRARKIWTQYPDSIDLKEETINPSNCLFPDVDWIIGNHSDELTPWVPVIAAKSSYKTQFFLLPCCSYEFSGEKYKRQNSSKSQYLDYMDFVENICLRCGFKVVRDRLKIPSTKRICFVSQGRVYGRDEIGAYCEKISELVKTGAHVKVRESVEQVRNCTKLDRNLVSDIVSQVSHLILRAGPSSSHSDEDWNEGGFVEMSEIARTLGSERLNKLKNECGGLQTLLRNHRFIFLIEQGRVKFRKPRVLPTRPRRWKVTPCWFYNNHPEACPLDDDQCSFVHEHP